MILDIIFLAVIIIFIISGAIRCFARAIMNIAAVSYTHLDVYKRQVIRRYVSMLR